MALNCDRNMEYHQVSTSRIFSMIEIVIETLNIKFRLNSIMDGFSRAVGSEQWALGSGQNQWETLFFLSFAVGYKSAGEQWGVKSGNSRVGSEGG